MFRVFFKGMNRHARRLILLLLEDGKMDEELAFFIRWSFLTSPTNMWLTQRRIILSRIIADRRIGVSNFVRDLVSRYCGLQFAEHFRMSPATFEVRYHVTADMFNFIYT